MDLPVITDEQRPRFEAEYEEFRAEIDVNPHLSEYADADYTKGANLWCLCRAYSEMQVQNLLNNGDIRLTPEIKLSSHF